MRNAFLLKIALLAVVALHLCARAEESHAFSKDIAAFEAADKTHPAPQNAILFVGDSTFTKWKTLQADLPGYTVINRGFGGSKMSDLLYYTDRVVLPYKPRMIVVQEGGNDLHGGRTPEQLLADIKAFITQVRATLPNVPIVIGGIAPNSARWSEADLRRRTNKLVKESLATEKNVTFIDFFDSFLTPEGKPNDDLFLPDKLHPNAAGYKLRVKIMTPFLGEPDVKK